MIYFFHGSCFRVTFYQFTVLIQSRKPVCLKVVLQKEFLELIQQHKGLIYKVCHIYAHDEASKQDLFQEIVIQLWKSFGSFRGEAKISTWMYRIALNTALTDLRKRKTKVDLHYTDQSNLDIEEVEYDSQRDEEEKLLYSAIAKLSQIEKAVVMMYLEDKSYEEMEEVLGISQGTLRVKMNRIKEKLRLLVKTESHGT